MRPIVYEAWKNAINEAVLREFPRFELVQKRTRSEPRGMLKYHWRAQEKLWCYIAFRPLDDEGFDAFVGWSVKDRFPFEAEIHIDNEHHIWDFEAPGLLVWSIQLAKRDGSAYWTFWDPLAKLANDPEEFARAFAAHGAEHLTYERAQKLVEPAVYAAIAEVREFGIPYLEQRAAYDSKS